MPELSLNGLSEIKAWEKADIKLPGYDVKAAVERTKSAPAWLHFGAGNIFRGYIAVIADTLLESSDSDTGIITAEVFDTDIVEKIYKPFDNLALSVSLSSEGKSKKQIVGSITEALTADEDDFFRLTDIIKQKSLQMVSFTITEKGYDGAIMATVTKLLYERFETGYPLALVSMDNCSRNGEKLKNAILKAAESYSSTEFNQYVNEKISFPWSMIDKITPRPAAEIQAELEKENIKGMDAVITSKNTYIAPFVNSEETGYLVIEDDFPNGRPPLEKAGVYLTTRETVMLAERMKVTTCLNPLHTALAVYGCLLGYTSIWEEMKDKELLALVKRIGYTEGLPAVVSPKIIEPRDFIDEVINKRLPNRFIPDTPQRIATDTSQKLAIRFSETVKAYVKENKTDELIGIPLVYAGWLRYLKGIDDSHKTFEISPDPMLSQLKGLSVEEILNRQDIFGIDLFEINMDKKILSYYKMMEEKGGVRKLLQDVLG